QSDLAPYVRNAREVFHLGGEVHCACFAIGHVPIEIPVDVVQIKKSPYARGKGHRTPRVEPHQRGGSEHIDISKKVIVRLRIGHHMIVETKPIDHVVQVTQVDGQVITPHKG